eukprot:728984-Hanusia_phi.AAC.1
MAFPGTDKYDEEQGDAGMRGNRENSSLKFPLVVITVTSSVPQEQGMAYEGGAEGGGKRRRTGKDQAEQTEEREMPALQLEQMG